MGPKTKKESAPTEHLTEYAFTPSGNAMKHNIADRKRHQEILAWAPPSSGVYSKVLDKNMNKRNESDWLRSSINYTEEELAMESVEDKTDVEPGRLRCAVVGLVMPWNSAKLNHQVEGLPPRTPVGVVLPNEVYVYLELEPDADNTKAKGKEAGTEDLVIDRKEVPLLAVVPITPRPPTVGIKIFVLLKPTSGLCNLYTVGAKEVFYFAEYRDGTTSKEERPRKWNAMVANYTVQPNLEEGEQRPAITAYATPRDCSTVVMDRRISLANDLCMLTSAFGVEPDDWLMEELNKVMSSAVSGLEKLPPKEYRHIRRFINITEDSENESESSSSDSSSDSDSDSGDSTDDDSGKAKEEEKKKKDWNADEMLKEIAIMWPETKLQDLTPSLLTSLRKSIIKAKLIMPFDHYEGFLRVAATMGSHIAIDWEDDKTSPFILDMVKAARCDTDETAMSKVVLSETAMYPALLSSVRNKLAEILATDQAFVAKMKAAVGSSTMSKSPAELWATFGDAIDTDTARLAWDMAQKAHISELSNKADLIHPMISMIIKVLDKAGVRESAKKQEKRERNVKKKAEKKAKKTKKTKKDTEMMDESDTHV